MIIGFDVDGVIYKMEVIQGYAPENFGEPIQGAKEFLERLRDAGICVVIYSCRMNPTFTGNQPKSVEELYSILKKKLDEDGIPYDAIAAFKPVCDVYVDDRGVRFTSWAQVEADLRHLFGVFDEYKSKS